MTQRGSRGRSDAAEEDSSGRPHSGARRGQLRGSGLQSRPGRVRNVGLIVAGVSLVGIAIAPLGGAAAAASTAATVSQSFGAATSAPSSTLIATAITATGPGDLLVVAIRDRNTSGTQATVTTVMDSAGNSWTKAARSGGGIQADEEIWYTSPAAAIASGGGVTVTVPSGSAIAMTVIDVAGAGTSILDVKATANSSGTAATTGTTAATTQASEVAVAAIGWNSKVTATPTGADTGYTPPAIEQSTGTNVTGQLTAFDELSASATQSYSATLSTSVGWTGVIATFQVGTSSTPTPTPTPPPGGAPHVMVIMDENVEYGGIIGSPNAPYLNSLATTYASATSWYAPEHISGADYRDLVGGIDNPTSSNPAIMNEFAKAGIPWRAYMESMPSNCYTGSQTPDFLYDAHHNPFKFFSGYTSWCSNLATEGVVPYPGVSRMVSALDSAGAPDYVWITPNTCDDMHGNYTSASPCPQLKIGSSLTVAGDDWLKANVAPVLQSSWFANNGVVIITWDEGSSNLGLPGGTAPDNGGHIATLVLSSKQKVGTFSTGGDHFGALRAIEEAYGVGLLGNSVNAADGDLRPAFGGI